MPTKMLAKGLTAPSKATPRRAVKLAPEGIVTAIVAVTGVTDAVADLIVPGAFAHTLKVRRPKVVDDHEWKNKVGRVLHVEEWMPGDRRLPKRTKDGKPWPAEAGALVATMQYNLRAERGREAYEWVRFYAESNEAEFSIGYKVPEGKARRRTDGVRVILMVDLFEFSHVLFGAAPLSMALDVKSMHGGSAGAVTKPALTGADDNDDDYTDPSEPIGDDKPWDDDERPRARIESKTAASVLLEAKSGNAGNPDSLRRWFAEGADGAIPWGSPGDFDACVALASKHMSPEDAKGFCNLRHHDALGIYPATHAAMEGKSADQEVKSMSRMKGSYQERTSLVEQAAQSLLEATHENPCVCVVATFDAEVIVTVYAAGEELSYLVPYSFNAETGTVALDEPQPVELSLVASLGGDRAEEAAEDVESVTVVGPMLESLNTTARIASIEGKVGQAVRDRLLSITASLSGKSAEQPDPDTDGDNDTSAAGDTDGDLLEADGDTITADNLPDGDWQEFRKTQPIEAMRMDGPFRVQTREGVVECEDGWLAVDSEGYPYPVAADEMENVYEPTDGAPAESTEDPLEEATEAPADELEEGTEQKSAQNPNGDDEETVKLDPDEHFKAMNDLTLDDEEDL